MSDAVILFPDPQNEPEYAVAFRQLLAEMERLNQLMDRDRKDIERLKTESDLLKVETRAILAALGGAV